MDYWEQVNTTRPMWRAISTPLQPALEWCIAPKWLCFCLFQCSIYWMKIVYRRAIRPHTATSQLINMKTNVSALHMASASLFINTHKQHKRKVIICSIMHSCMCREIPESGGACHRIIIAVSRVFVMCKWLRRKQQKILHMCDHDSSPHQWPLRILNYLLSLFRRIFS